jgi:hypothetical protein
MNKNEFLETVKKQVLYIFDRQDIVYELSEHIDDSARDMMEEGLSYDEALDIAIKQMGNPVEIGKQLNKEHHPLVGYLLLLSRAILCLLVIPSIIFGCSLIYDMYYHLTPTTIRGGTTIIKIQEVVEIPTHRIMIDNVCYKDDMYYLTYRSFTKFSYSRAGWSTDSFEVTNQDGDWLFGGSFHSGSMFGGYGYTEISLPEDGKLYLHFRDKQIVTIDLQEYGYE